MAGVRMQFLLFRTPNYRHAGAQQRQQGARRGRRHARPCASAASTGNDKHNILHVILRIHEVCVCAEALLCRFTCFDMFYAANVCLHIVSVPHVP